MGKCDSIWKFTLQNRIYKWPKRSGTTCCICVTELPHYFKLFFTNRLFSGIITETNFHDKLVNRKLLQHSICQIWEKVNRKEFFAFIVVILNICRMLVANIQEYWSKQDNSWFLSFFFIFFTIKVEPNFLDSSFQDNSKQVQMLLF